MILGKIIGKVTTVEFEFIVTNEQNSKKLEFVQVIGEDNNYYLCQIAELYRDSEKTIAKCRIIGAKDLGTQRILQPRIPFKPDSEVVLASDSFIKEILLEKDNTKSAYLGNLEGRNIPVLLDLNKILTKHVSILAKSGAGKSYCSGVLIEEILERKIPIIIFDPHGEYSSIKYPNQNPLDKIKLESMGLFPKSYPEMLLEYADPSIVSDVLPIRLKDEFSPMDLISLLPSKITPGQKALLFSVIKNLDKLSLSDLIYAISSEENPQKYSLIGTIDFLRSFSIFSEEAIRYEELVKKGQITLFNLKGYPPYVQQIILFIVAKNLFDLRKKSKIPPFFLVVEEAHNFCPERSFGESRSSQILRMIASEGRKFGLGLCIISQRPARIDKSVLSQCSTQIILKITNPNDLKSISNSVEGITYETESDIINLPIGTAIVSGFVDVPLIVSIRPRKTKHGGEAQKALEEEEKVDFLKKVESYNEDTQNLLFPRTTPKDIELMTKKKISKIKTILIPSLYVVVEDNQLKKSSILIELVTGKQIIDLDNKSTSKEIKSENLVHYTITRSKIDYDEKMSANIKKEDALKLLKDFKIQDVIDCYSITYSVIYETQ
ncbi:MAG TPA: ATP-binding protein [Candidatus Woesearchaeota archaeon]|nr:ATP-binding protein [Candidatus Woesearchaeota archaeon]